MPSHSEGAPGRLVKGCPGSFQNPAWPVPTPDPKAWSLPELVLVPSGLESRSCHSLASCLQASHFSPLECPHLQIGQTGRCRLWAEASQTSTTAHTRGRKSGPGKQLAESRADLGRPRSNAEVTGRPWTGCAKSPVEKMFGIQVLDEQQ